MTRKAFYIASAATMAASVASIVTYSVKKATKGKASAFYLLAGVAGLALSAALATKPDRDATKLLGEAIMLDDASGTVFVILILTVLVVRGIRSSEE